MASSADCKAALDEDVYDASLFYDALQQLLKLANDLCIRTEKLLHIPGVNKLLKKCQAEMRFLHNVKQKNEIKKCYINSTNLVHLKGVVDAVENLPHVVHVLQTFTSPDTTHPICVDVVCNYGYTWAKVIARKPEALHRVWAGCSEYGEKPLTEQASQYQVCAALYRVSYRIPRLLFIFANGVPTPLASDLEQLGLLVFGERIPENRMAVLSEWDDDSDDDDDDGDDVGGDGDGCKGSDVDEVDGNAGIASGVSSVDNEQSNTLATSADYRVNSATRSSLLNTRLNLSGINELFEDVPTIDRVNLDITTLIAFVSNLCHGGCHYVFKEDVLTQQAEMERQSPLLPQLESFIKDKDLFVCDTALHDFQSILETVAGQEEKLRAKALLEKITVIRDEMSERAKQLHLSHQVKQRAKLIFGTGDHIQAVTMSANSGFIRAAANQGVTFAVFLHQPRALTEQKEKTATHLDKTLADCATSVME